jgi:CBS domain-containing membrane protein
MPEDERYPLGGRMSDVVLGLGRRLRLPALMDRHSSVFVLGLFAFVNGCISIGLMALVALATGQPFVLPSLGPTVFLLFYTPEAPAASPRNTVGGISSGWWPATCRWPSAASWAKARPWPWESPRRAWRRRCRWGLTAGAMAWLRLPHPPAGATTLIVSLGLITEVPHLAVLMLGVVLLVLQGFAINRLAGMDYPAWAPRRG